MHSTKLIQRVLTVSSMLTRMGHLGRQRGRPNWPAAGGMLVLLLSLALLPAATAGGPIQSPGAALLASSAGLRAATTAGTTWYFAEGFTGPGFDEYLTIYNPGSAATATITYYVEGETTPIPRVVNLPANSRTTVAVHAAFDATANPGGLGRRTVGHSTKVEATSAIVVEHPIYFTYNNTITGGHNTTGANDTARAWLFGEGFTGSGFDEYLTIQNPGPTAGLAAITYYVEGQTNPTLRAVNLPANSRTTVAVHGAYDATTNPGGLDRQSVGHATRVESTVPTVVERPTYFTYNTTVTGGHNAVGLTGTLTNVCYATLSGANEVPPVAAGGSGAVRLAINPATGAIEGTWTITGLSAITAGHIHQAPVGVNGPIVVPFSGIPANGGNFSTNSAASPGLAADILANPANYYVNIHTGAYADGALRGQLSCVA